MHKIIAPITLFAFVLIGCSEGESTEMSAENDEMKIDSLIVDEFFDISNADSLVDEYKHRRIAYLESNYSSDFEEYEVIVSGSFYHTNGDLAIYNFIEKWGVDYIEYSVVTNAIYMRNGLENNDMNDYGGLVDFLKQSFPENTAYYKGNFEDAPAYQLVDYQSLLLTESYNRNTYFESKSTFYFLTSSLEEKPIVANTMGYDGECEKFKGFKEKFVLGPDLYQVVVEREENTFDQECNLLHSINYKKVWSEAHILFVNEGGPPPEVPEYFVMDFTNSSEFSELPKEFLELTIEGEDTLYNGSDFKISNSQMGNQNGAFIHESDYFVEDIFLMIGFEKEADSSFTIYKRVAGLNSDNYVSDLTALKESEQNQELIELNIKLISEKKGVYLLTYPDNGNEYLYTIQKEVFETAEIETDL